MPLEIIRQDITRMKTDAIVNAANSMLVEGGGVCGAIFRAAGAKDLAAACQPLAPIQVGQAVITPGFGLPAPYIIHTLGPVYQPAQQEECARALHQAYTSSLNLAKAQGLQSIAFPLISSGLFGYPKAAAMKVAREAIRDFLEKEEMDIYLVVFDKKAYQAGSELMGEVASYIDEHYVEEHADSRRSLRSAEQHDLDMATAAGPSLSDMLLMLDETFVETMNRLMVMKGKSSVEVYKNANMDKKLFSKIGANKHYQPSKNTVLALAVSLELNLEETKRLLGRAGFALSSSQVADVIIEYFIIKGKYNIFEINEVLFQYDQKILGGKNI